MSREKLISKLLLSIQAFTYTCCSESFEARRTYRKCTSSSDEVAKKCQDSSVEAVISRFGISGVVCDGRLITMPHPSSQEDSGAWPFDGRLGKLRYFALTVMAASGAVAADLVHLVLSFPLQPNEAVLPRIDIDEPDRAPIAYPLLFGNILTHVVAAMCATCGRARARSDSLDVAWSIPFSPRGSFVFSDLYGRPSSVDSVLEDCEGFLKLGMLARVLQVILGSMDTSSSGIRHISEWISTLNQIVATNDGKRPHELMWILTCTKVLSIATANQNIQLANLANSKLNTPTIHRVQEACSQAASAAASFLIDASTILQILVPGSLTKYNQTESKEIHPDIPLNSPLVILEKVSNFLKLEPIHDMVEAPLVHAVLTNWYDSACRHEQAAFGLEGTVATLKGRLYRTQGYRVYDWPSAGVVDQVDGRREPSDYKDSIKPIMTESQPHDDVVPSDLQISSFLSQSLVESTAEILRSKVAPSLLAFKSKKSVSLLGGFSPHAWNSKNTFGCGIVDNSRPRVSVIPTSYTDLYAELASLLPDCEQTAVSTTLYNPKVRLVSLGS